MQCRDDHLQAEGAQLGDRLGDDVFIRIDQVQPASQRIQRDAGKDLLSVAADVDHAGMGAARENGDSFPLHVGGQETLVHDPRIRFPVPIGCLPVMGLKTPLEAASGPPRPSK